MPELVRLRVNGRLYEVAAAPTARLVDVLRNQLSLTGAKEGCSTGQCGACTVLLDGRPATSCLVFAGDAVGREITTIEGLAPPGRLHPLQQAFVDHGAVQCGFCTPGMVLTAKALLDEHPDPTDQQIRQALAGNLCRCTGYRKIFDAIKAYARSSRGERKGGRLKPALPQGAGRLRPALPQEGGRLKPALPQGGGRR
jgi:carbon-monoxide dehydrogenase small subunit